MPVPISFTTADDGGGGNNTNSVTATPGTHQEGDLILVRLWTSGINTPGSLTLDGSTPGWVENANAGGYATDGTDRRTQVFTKFAESASETAPIFNKPLSCRAGAIIEVWREVGSAIFDVTPQVSTVGDPHTSSAPPITPQNPNGALSIAMYAPDTTDHIASTVQPLNFTKGVEYLEDANYRSFIQAYQADYGVAELHTPDVWNITYEVGTCEDLQDQGSYDGSTDLGSFNGGSGFNNATDIGSTIQLSQNIFVTIDRVAAGGDVDQFTIDSSGDTTGGLDDGSTLSQSSTNAPSGGTGFSVTMGLGNKQGVNTEIILSTIALTPEDEGVTLTDTLAVNDGSPIQ